MGVSRSDLKVLSGSIDSRLTQSLFHVCYGFGGARKLMFSYRITKAVLEATTFRLLTVVKVWRGVVP